MNTIVLKYGRIVSLFLFCTNIELLRVKSEDAILKKLIKHMKNRRERMNREVDALV